MQREHVPNALALKMLSKRLGAIALGAVGIVTLLLGVLTALVLADLIGFAAVRQRQDVRSARAIIDAEILQEPYRGTDWGRAYWEELGAYRERWETYFVYRVNDTKGRYLNVSNGVRRTYTSTVAHDERRPLVFVFGGSAAWGHGARDLETLPSWLARVAEEHAQPIDVRNYAESGWVNWQGIIYLLQKLSDGERPDVVIFYSGVNEYLSGQQWPQVRRPIWDGEMVPHALHDYALEQNRPVERLSEFYRRNSFLAGRFFPVPSSLPVRPALAQDELAKRIASDYAGDKATVEALGRSYGFDTLFVWQLTVADKRQLSDQERQYAGWLPPSERPTAGLDWWLMSPEMRTLYQQIGSMVMADAAVVDASPAFEGVSRNGFIDWMHAAESGNESIARLLYQHVTPLLARRSARRN